MRLSITNIAWSADSDSEILAYLGTAGFAGLEIAPTRIFPEKPYDHPDRARAWAGTLKDTYGLDIPSMQSIWYGRAERMFGPEDERRTLADYTKRAILFAEAIGCGNLVFGNPKNRDTDDVTRDEPAAIEFFREIGDFAAAHGTVVALEPNPVIYNTRLMNTTEQAVEMAQKVNSAGIKVNIDLGTMLHNGESLEYLLDIPGWINHVHISEPYLAPLRRRDAHRRLFEILHEIDYRRYVSIEMGNSSTVDDVKKTIDYVSQLNETI